MPSTQSQEPQDKQQEIRSFVGDLVDRTIGESDLRSWVKSSVREKIDHDIGRIYPISHLQGSAKVRKIAQEINGYHEGVLYVAPQGMIISVEMIEKNVIKVFKTSPEIRKEPESLRLVAEACIRQGLAVSARAVVYIPYDSNSKNDIWSDVYGSEDLETSRSFATGLILAVITQSSDRDIQRMPGPSDLSNPCDLCVARRIAGATGIDFPQTPNNFSLKAWVGTSVHQKLERDIPQHNAKAHQELTVRVGRIEGLGEIKGHVDLYLPEVATMSDFKTTDTKKLEVIRSRRVPVSHRGQTMLYMRGLRQSGRPCSYATLAYIPRDSTKKSDIWTASCAYREDIAVGLLNRAQDLFRKLQVGDLDFASDPDCFVCHYQRYTRS